MLSIILAIIKFHQKAEKYSFSYNDRNIYYADKYKNEAQVFAISIKDIQSSVEKKTSTKTYSKSFLHQKYHNFVHLFRKKNSNSGQKNRKYNHKM